MQYIYVNLRQRGNMKTEIYNLDERFLDEIEIIENASFKSPWSKSAYLSEVYNESAFYKVITVENEVVGYGGFRKIFDEAHITNIAVKESFRSRGFGKMIMEELIEQARELEISSMTLEVRVSNISAVKLYEKMGFKSAGVRPKYYGDGEDAFIMWLEDLNC